MISDVVEQQNSLSKMGLQFQNLMVLSDAKAWIYLRKKKFLGCILVSILRYVGAFAVMKENAHEKYRCLILMAAVRKFCKIKTALT